MAMSLRLKISHRKHSGRLRPHEYTSYVPLSALLIVVGVALAIVTVSAASPSPGAGSVGLSGTMPGPAPTVAATISSPTNNQHFSVTPVTVKGSCPKATLVEVYKNDIFAGSVPCSDMGTYSLDVDLLIGKNVLVSRVYNDLNQPGPDSNSVTVYYDALPQQASVLSGLNFGGSQLLLNTDAVYRGSFPNQEMTVPIDIIGGTPPYAVNVQWGDSTNKVIPRNDNQSFTTSHAYTKAGIYQLTLQGTDAQGRTAFLRVAAIINGQPGVAAIGTSGGASMNKLLALWPLYTASVAIVISFWLGERREKHILGGNGPIYHTPAHA